MQFHRYNSTSVLEWVYSSYTLYENLIPQKYWFQRNIGSSNSSTNPLWLMAVDSSANFFFSPKYLKIIKADLPIRSTLWWSLTQVMWFGEQIKVLLSPAPAPFCQNYLLKWFHYSEQYIFLAQERKHFEVIHTSPRKNWVGRCFRC